MTIEQAGNKVANIFENMYNASLLDNSLVIDIDDINNNANTVISNINTFVNNTVSVEYGLQAVDDNLTSEQRSTLQGIFNTNSLHFTALGYTI